MKPFWVAFLGGCFWVILSLSGSAELLMNGSFETAIGSSDYGNWFAWGGVVATNSNAHEGTACASIRNASEGHTYGGFEQKVAVQPFTEYQASFYFRWDDSFFAADRQFCIDWRNEAGTVLSSQVFTIGLEGPDALWYFSGYYPLSSPASATEAEIRFNFSDIESNGALYFDQVSFERSTNRIHRLRNAGFERELGSFDLDNWAHWGSVDRLPYHHRGGTVALAIKGWNGSPDSAGVSQSIDVEEGTNYVASFWTYSDVGFTSTYHVVAIDWFDASGSTIDTETFDVDISDHAGSWSFSGDIHVTAPLSAVRGAIRFAYSGIQLNNTTHYIDDVRFQEARQFFHATGTEIHDPADTPFLPLGLVLSGWLFPEGYFWGIPDGTHLDSCTRMRNRILEILGSQERAKQFWEYYYNAFLKEEDIVDQASRGANMVRLPFNYRDLSPENNPGAYNFDYFKWFDRCIEWCKRHNLAVVLDMHCAPGGAADKESGDPEYLYHVDHTNAAGEVIYTEELGVACLWESNDVYYARTGRTPESNQQRTAEIWSMIAERYKNEEAIIGYELVNEPNLRKQQEPPTLLRTNLVAKMRTALINITEGVRDVDQNHILFFQGDWFGNCIDGLTPKWDDNMALAVHRYWQTFELDTWFSIQKYLDTRDAHQIPVWMGETGENTNPWLYEQNQLFRSLDIGTCWWGWKKMGHNSVAYSIQPPAAFDYVRTNFWESELDCDLALSSLQALADAAITTNCVFLPAFYWATIETQSLFNVCSTQYRNHTLPGRIHFSDYDYGNQGIAYSDTNYFSSDRTPSGNRGGAYRNDGVDIAISAEGNGYKVNWTTAGEWMKYTVNILFPGTYDMTFRIQSGGSSQIRLVLNDTQNLTGIINLPATGNWNDDTAFTSYTITNLPIASQGIHTVKVEFVNGAVDLSHLDITFSSSHFIDGDADGMDDHWEYSFGGNLDQGSDSDGDGLSNLNEYFACTDPTNASSRLATDVSESSSAGENVLAVQSSTNRVYSFQYSTNLASNIWSDIITNVPGTDGLLSLVVTNDSLPAVAYYRIKAETP